MGTKPIVQQKKQANKYWKLGVWGKLTEYECQHILGYHRTWNLVRENTGDNGKQATSTKYEMNRQIKQIQ